MKIPQIFIYEGFSQLKNGKIIGQKMKLVLQFQKVFTKCFSPFSIKNMCERIADSIKLNATYSRNYQENKNFAHGHCIMLQY